MYSAELTTDLSLRVSIMGPDQPFNFLGLFMVNVVTLFLVFFSTNLRHNYYRYIQTILI